MEVWKKFAERWDNGNSTHFSAILIYLECWCIRARITSTVKAKGHDTLAKFNYILQTQLGTSSSSPWSSKWWNCNFLTQETLHLPTQISSNPPAQQPPPKDGRQKPKILPRACCTTHLYVFKSHLLTTRWMLSWWWMCSLQALPTHLLSPWVRRTATLWSSPTPTAIKPYPIKSSWAKFHHCHGFPDRASSSSSREHEIAAVMLVIVCRNSWQRSSTLLRMVSLTFLTFILSSKEKKKKSKT